MEVTTSFEALRWNGSLTRSTTVKPATGGNRLARAGGLGAYYGQPLARIALRYSDSIHQPY